MIIQDGSDGGDLRDLIATFVAKNVETADAPEGPRVDRDTWSRACSELGVAAIDVPEDLDGVGAGFGALAAVVEEAGRRLARWPVLGSVVVAQHLLVESADAEGLAGLLDGSQVAAVVLDADLSVEWLDGVPRLTGRVPRVMDLMSADLLVLAVPDADGVSVVRVPVDASGVTRASQRSMDLTRDFGTLELDGVEATLVGERGAAMAAVATARHRLAVAVACEQLGSAQQALDDAVEYTRTRIQFGREIASFQAIKHRCADLAIEVDELRSAVAHGVWAVATDAAGVDLAVAMAAASGARVHLRCALENVQLHGGIGFTWEHSAHLHVRRAESHVALHGDDARHHEAVLAALGI